MMLYLSEKEFLGQGISRKVYYHPGDKNKCIKISIDGIQDTDTREELRYRRICKKTLFEEYVITQRISPWNLLIQHISEQESRIRLVDDIGMHRVLIPRTFFQKHL